METLVASKNAKIGRIREPTRDVKAYLEKKSEYWTERGACNEFASLHYWGARGKTLDFIIGLGKKKPQIMVLGPGEGEGTRVLKQFLEQDAAALRLLATEGRVKLRLRRNTAVRDAEARLRRIEQREKWPPSSYAAEHTEEKFYLSRFALRGPIYPDIDVFGLLPMNSSARAFIRHDFSMGVPFECLDPGNGAHKEAIELMKGKYDLVLARYSIGLHTNYPAYSIFCAALLLNPGGKAYVYAREADAALLGRMLAAYNRQHHAGLIFRLTKIGERDWEITRAS